MELIQRKELEDSLRQEFEGTLPDRVARYLEVKPHEIVPDRHFAPVSTECALLFRDGHFYGCIAMTQAVTEALVRFLCERNSWSPKDDFLTNVRKLREREKISDEVGKALRKIWRRRNSYHHLDAGVARGRRALENLAREKARLLAEVEREVFRYKIINGKLVPERPQYWEPTDDSGLTEVFLRLGP